ncbi:hypothetical protein ACTWP5_00180 [Streptomyces sp. 4N509B]|uniref:hypothetical protein n=1 Tax=Streptomyces sp. 4N509B TaxID=3457413 RepID=UPI003FD20944
MATQHRRSRPLTPARASRSARSSHSSRTRLSAAALGLAVAAGAWGVTGCGGEERPADAADPGAADADDPTTRRLAEVAQAWRGSNAADEWAEGYYPVDDHIQLPDGGLRGTADLRAFTRLSFRTRVELPERGQDDGLVSARAAFDRLDSGYAASWPDRPALEVTGVELGTMEMRTNEGPAEIPAWLFALDGYDTPLRVAAVAEPEEMPRAPVEPLGPGVGADTSMQLLGLVSVSRDGGTIAVAAGHGACDDGPAIEVLETADSVVVAGSVVTGPDPAEACTGQLLSETLTHELSEPLGDRPVLDAFNGRVLRPSTEPGLVE